MLTPAALLSAYAQGIFPMAEGRNDARLHWLDPRRRGIIPLDNIHISRSLSREIRRQNFTIRTNNDFEAVIEGCADRDETWINEQLAQLYLSLFAMGYAHSLEVWQDGLLIGGIFGISLGAAFFGESMFSRRTNGSKIALVYLVERLRRGGFTLFDTQFLTPHLRSMGGVEISREDYHTRLKAALQRSADFNAPEPATVDQVLEQRRTQTS